MKRWLLAPAILATVLSSGCGTFWEIAAINIGETPLNGLSNHARRKRLTELATNAYHEFEVEHSEDPPSCDFGKGFVDGFVDYVESGGDGEAPANPPWRYTLSRYDTPEGRQAVLDYQDGFRKGSAVAIDSGYRELVLIRPGQAPAPATDPNQRRIANASSNDRSDPVQPMAPAKDDDSLETPVKDLPTPTPEKNP